MQLSLDIWLLQRLFTSDYLEIDGNHLSIQVFRLLSSSFSEAVVEALIHRYP